MRSTAREQNPQESVWEACSLHSHDMYCWYDLLELSSSFHTRLMMPREILDRKKMLVDDQSFQINLQSVGRFSVTLGGIGVMVRAMHIINNILRTAVVKLV